MSNTIRLDDDRRLIRLTDEAFVFGSYPFCGLIVTDAGCVAIDGPMSPRNCDPWKEFIDSKGPLRYQVYCEHHGDHTASAPFLQPDVLITSERTRSEMESTAQMLESFTGWAYDPQLGADALDGYEMRYPSLTYNDRMTIELGGKHFVLFEGVGHTLGSTIVHAVEDRVAFIADNGITPAIQSGDPFAWLRTVAVLETLDVDWYVQGHGDPFAKDGLQRWREVLLAAIDRCRDLKAQGVTPQEIVEMGGVFPGLERPDHTGTADFPPNLRAFSSTVLQEHGAERIYEALERHESAQFWDPPLMFPR